ncbi:hypothetical protein UCRPA7_3562 [Phaeoacremonium minimum UCRPA7]|uniref:Uncharacterized protein n=1 Tax=Phaeoacremonium minimum (strain UCR-PA7) TaxID=1286976 RepID=R8BNN5_PHAM7|nr:hypothetical protein UCRPA7_3562 [Phaeoacremonium minimum UCRPA7]EOO00956.1 hypothetical protein UCRPA7_3562 [Phaeoacremonium minimum UCRPA7]
MARNTWQTVPKKLAPSKSNKRNPTKVNAFRKLFPADSHLFAGGVTGRSVADVRRLIYAQVWSRERRDDFKSDFVVSEYGIDRNVMQYSHYYDQQGYLRRETHYRNRPNLLFVNKQISDDLLQFVYSINTLEIDVDLKSRDTPDARTSFNNIIARLRGNPYFQRFTQALRVRIHFPDDYPRHNLPAINQAILEEISGFIDGCQSLSALQIHVVMMEGMNDYELRYAAFPFYPLKFTGWNISVLNLQTYRFDRVQNEEVHHLNKAWDHYIAHGTLTAKIPQSQSKMSHVPTRPGSPESMTPQNGGSQNGGSQNGGTQEAALKERATKNKNGSKKKKARKAGDQVTPPQSAPPSVAGDHVPLQNGDPPSPPSTPTTPKTPTEGSIGISNTGKQYESRSGSVTDEDQGSIQEDRVVEKTIEASKEMGSEETNIHDSSGHEQYPAIHQCKEHPEEFPRPVNIPLSPARSASSSATLGRGASNKQVFELKNNLAHKNGTVAKYLEDGCSVQVEDRDPLVNKKALKRKRQREKARREAEERKAAAESQANESEIEASPIQTPTSPARIEVDAGETNLSESPASSPRRIVVYSPTRSRRAASRCDSLPPRVDGSSYPAKVKKTKKIKYTDDDMLQRGFIPSVEIGRVQTIISMEDGDDDLTSRVAQADDDETRVVEELEDSEDDPEGEEWSSQDNDDDELSDGSSH